MTWRHCLHVITAKVRYRAKMGISHRLHALVKYAKNLVELFPECKIHMIASGTVPSGFKFQYSNFTAEQLVQLDIDTDTVSCDGNEGNTQKTEEVQSNMWA